MRGKCVAFRPDHNGECLTCDEWIDAHDPGAERPLADGLYCVETATIGAAFLVKGGQVRKTDCAPILWRRLAYWKTRAVLVRRV